MRTLRVMLATSLIVAAPVASHDWDAKPIENPEYRSPFEAWEGWRAVGTTADGNGVAYVGLIERAGTSVTFETVVVYREKVARHGDYAIDQEHNHWIGDCGNAEIRSTKKQDFLFGGTAAPPPINIRSIGSDPYKSGLVVAQPGTLLATALNVACRFNYDGPAGVIPYANASEHFRSSAKTP